ncbi:MAG: sugar phosphate isomerase/epimerase [Acetatifactor sp.]|nr:sugar phosphate isomerase/epimerase [Acetatifactor sp.]
MNKIGVHSMGLRFRYATAKELDEKYKMIKDAGFDCVDFGFDEYLPVNDVYGDRIDTVLELPLEEAWKTFEPHFDAAKRHGILFEQMHAPFPMFVEGREDLSERMFNIIVNSMEICACMGGKYIVVHPVTMAYHCSKQEEHDANVAVYKELIPTARKCGLVICLENLFLEKNYHMMEGFGSDFREASELIDELNEYAGEEVFGFCFDVGHANLLGKNMYQALLTPGNRLKILHIHDNDGISDLHTMPYTFARSWSGSSTDWEGFLKGLKEIQYQGVLSFETARCMEGFPVELHPAVLNLLCQTGKYFAKHIS